MAALRLLYRLKNCCSISRYSWKFRKWYQLFSKWLKASAAEIQTRHMFTVSASPSYRHKVFVSRSNTNLQRNVQHAYWVLIIMVVYSLSHISRIQRYWLHSRKHLLSKGRCWSSCISQNVACIHHYDTIYATNLVIETENRKWTCVTKRLYHCATQGTQLGNKYFYMAKLNLMRYSPETIIVTFNVEFRRDTTVVYNGVLL